MIPLEPTLAMLQCLAFPKSLENMKTVINAQNSLAGTANITINSPGVPCLRLPIGGRAGMTVALGVIESKEANWGMGLLPPMIAAGSAAPTMPMPAREEMEREMIGLLRSVKLPNIKSTSVMAAMLQDDETVWEDFEEIPLPALWEEYSGTRHRNSGKSHTIHDGQSKITMLPSSQTNSGCSGQVWGTQWDVPW